MLKVYKCIKPLTAHHLYPFYEGEVEVIKDTLWFVDREYSNSVKLGSGIDTKMKISKETLIEHFIEVDESEWWNNYEQNQELPYHRVGEGK